MSRHRNFKNMAFEEELEDYDGHVDYEYGYTSDEVGTVGSEELSTEDQERMIVGTVAVRAEVGDAHDSRITDAAIKEALWHYYWDVTKAVEYLKETASRKAKKENLAKKTSPQISSRKGSPNGRVSLIRAPTRICGNQNAFVPMDFWSDMAWLNVPEDRQTLFVAPIYPRGLMGGSSEKPKMSKLQALAAARRKKALEQKNGESAEGVENPMMKLAISKEEDGLREKISAEDSVKKTPRTYPERKRKNSSPHEKIPQPSEPLDMEAPATDHIPPSASVEQAQPSAFASAMFRKGNPAATWHPARSLFTLPYCTNASIPSTDAFAGPSPDDVVIAAQSKAAAKSKGPVKTSAEKKIDQIANDVEAVKLDDTPRAKSKNLDVLAEFKKSKTKNAANFVVIGHVDAGKSTLMGRLLYDLNIVDQRTIEKYRKEAEKIGKSSFALAWVLDQGTEERSRGVTIDIAMNKFETDKTAFTILDAPGHRDFIPNMIAGASQADFAVLVIDASRGSFESGLKGQTREHALLVRSMGVQRLIIAINKLDTVLWSQDRFDEISQQVSAFLTSAGFLPRNITYIPMSGLLGDNIARRSTEAKASWYAGPTLVEALDASEPVSRSLESPLRLTVGDVFRGGVQNPLSISGRIEAGTLQSGDALIVLPANQKCFIKSLEIDTETADWAVAGQNVTLHLSDIDPVHLKVGDMLCSPTSPIRCVDSFVLKVLAFEHLLPMGLDVHRGRLQAVGKIVELAAILDKGTGAVAKRKPKIVKPGSIARVLVKVEEKVSLESGMRVVLRSGGATVGAGLLE